VEPLLHVWIPFAVALIVGIRWKKALLLSLIALTPDFDMIFHMHRILFHSVVVLGLIMVIVSILLWKTKLFHVRDICLAVIFLASHLVLDLFSGYSALFWPFSEFAYGFTVRIAMSFGSPFNLSQYIQFHVVPVAQLAKTQEGFLLTDVGAATSVLFGGALVVRKFLTKIPVLKKGCSS
jgi:membrane-bound metal-dependent hydrolase YbcI (DUF457 family)